MNGLLKELLQMPEARALLDNTLRGDKPLVTGVSPVHRAMLAAAMLQETGRPMLALCGAWGFTGNPLVGMVMAGALLCDMMLGAVAGGSIPLIFRALGRDPAQASSIFLTTITDGAGFFIFLGLATMFLF